MQTVWIVVAIAVAVVLIVLVLAIGSGRIGRFSGRARGKYGNNELEVGAEIDESRQEQLKRQVGTVVKGTKIIGKNSKMRVSGNDKRVQDTLMKGENLEFIVNESDNRSPNRLPQSDDEDRV